MRHEYSHRPTLPPVDEVRRRANELAQTQLTQLHAAIAATQAGLPDWAEIARLADAIEADETHKLCGLLTEAERATVATARAHAKGEP